jgi:hypothetical protein
MLVEDFYTPQDGGGETITPSARRIIAVIASYPNPNAMKAFEEIKTAEDLEKKALEPGVKTRSFLVAQMDSGI